MRTEFIRLDILISPLKTHNIHPLILTMKTEKPKKRLTRKEVLETIRKEDGYDEYLKEVVKGRKH